jgi:CHAT domain-containing protein/tetratricopeptide (TPR) repeat protein
VLVAALIVSAAACATRTEQQIAQSYESAKAELWRGALPAATSLAEQGLQRATKSGESPWTWRFKLLIAEIKLVSRDVPAAARLLQDAPPKASGFEWIVAKHRYLQGQLALIQGKPADAVAILDDARQLADRSGAFDVRLDIGALKGQALSLLRQWAAAESVLTETIADAQQHGDRYHEAVALVNLGAADLLRDRFDHALQYFERALSFKELQSQLVYAVALTNAGICYQRLGEFDRAIDVERRAVASHEQPGRPRIYYVRALGELGTTYVYVGDQDKSADYLKRAIDVAKSAGMNNEAARWASNLAFLFIQQRQWDLAEAANTDSGRLSGEQSDLAAYYVSNTAEIALGRGRTDEAERLLRETLAFAKNRPSLEWAAHRGLGKLAIALRKPMDAQREFEAAIGVVERTRSELLKADYRLSFLTPLLSLYQDYIDLLVDQGQFEQALVIADSSRGRVLAERQGVAAPVRSSPGMLRRIAGDLNASLLMYWLGPRRSYAWLVTAKGIRFVPLSAPVSRVGELVRAYQQSIVTTIADPLASTISPGDELYRLVVGPVAQWVPRGSRVVIAPDTALNTLNFETLPVAGDRRHYWIEDVEIAVAPSLGNLSAAVSPPQRERSALLIGDAVPADAKYPALRYASAEMKAIASAFNQRASVYSADQATPARYLESQPGRFDIVHFTAHADANVESPLDSAVILSKGRSGYKLYARDVAGQQLNADLVTISACRSAGERTYGGEGLVGFAWAFLRAGAKRVIAGLWDVDDRSTAELMGKMYASLASGASPGTALRDVKLQMIKAGGAMSKPYYWAPFQLFIGSRVVP